MYETNGLIIFKVLFTVIFYMESVIQVTVVIISVFVFCEILCAAVRPRGRSQFFQRNQLIAMLVLLLPLSSFVEAVPTFPLDLVDSLRGPVGLIDS